MDTHWKMMNYDIASIRNETAQDLWNNACNYFKWCDEHPIKVKRLLGSGKLAGQSSDEFHARPYTVKGLCAHCNILEEYLRDIRATKNDQSEYYHVVSKILYLIYIQNVEGAMIGIYSPMFTSKVLMLDKDDVPTGSVKVEIVAGLPELSTSESEVLQKMELEMRGNPLG